MVTIKAKLVRLKWPKGPLLAWVSRVGLAPVIRDLFIASGAILIATALPILINLSLLDIGPFAFVFPAIVWATLVAGWRCGLMVLFGCQALVWYFIIPRRESFVATTTNDAVSLLLATVVQLLLVWFLSRYRTAQKKQNVLLENQRLELDKARSHLKQQTDSDQQIRRWEAALCATRQNLEAIYLASGDGLALCEAFRNEEGHVVEYQVLEVNRAHAELTGATRDQMLTQRVSTIYPPIDPRWFDTAEKALDTGLLHEFDIRSRATGRWLNIRVSRVSDKLFQQTFVDISSRHKMEQQRRSLLTEMNHRVMNNFAMIAGFLHMSAAKVGPKSREHFIMAERRIHVLAKMHSILAYSDTEGEINVGEYIREICGYLESTFERPEAITMVCETRDLMMPTEKVVPLGFVVTELVTNSAKYAYPPPMVGTIRVSLLPSPNGWLLTIEDDGIGLSHAEPQETGGLGTILVRRFIQQIDAELTTTVENGVRHHIKLKTRD